MVLHHWPSNNLKQPSGWEEIELEKSRDPIGWGFFWIITQRLKFSQVCRFCKMIVKTSIKNRCLWKKEQIHKDKPVLTFEASYTRSNIPPCTWVEYYEYWDKLKFWIRGLALTTCSDNVWWRLKLPTYQQTTYQHTLLCWLFINQ